MDDQSPPRRSMSSSPTQLTSSQSQDVQQALPRRMYMGARKTTGGKAPKKIPPHLFPQATASPNCNTSSLSDDPSTLRSTHAVPIPSAPSRRLNRRPVVVVSSDEDIPSSLPAGHAEESTGVKHTEDSSPSYASDQSNSSPMSFGQRSQPHFNEAQCLGTKSLHSDYSFPYQHLFQSILTALYDLISP